MLERILGCGKGSVSKTTVGLERIQVPGEDLVSRTASCSLKRIQGGAASRAVHHNTNTQLIKRTSEQVPLQGSTEFTPTQLRPNTSEDRAEEESPLRLQMLVTVCIFCLEPSGTGGGARSDQRLQHRHSEEKQRKGSAAPRLLTLDHRFADSRQLESKNL